MSHESIIDEKQRIYESRLFRVMGVVCGIGSLINCILSFQFDGLLQWIFQGFALILLIIGIISYISGEKLRPKKENLRYW